MHHKPPRFTAGLVFTVGLTVAILTQVAKTQPSTKAEQGLAGQDLSGQDLSGEQLVARAVAQLARHPSLQARIRQRVNLFGQKLVGNGIYLQSGQQPPRRLRLEMKVQLERQQATVQQVCDGRFFWTRRDLPGERVLQRIDLDAVRRAGLRSRRPDVLDEHWVMLGGLPRLLQGLADNFQFGPPRAAQLGSEPVWVVEGRWLHQTAEARAAEAPAQRPDWPHQPDAVVLVLARGPALEYFPFQIDFRKTVSGGPRGDQPVSESIAVMELFEARVGHVIDPRRFVYDPGEENPEDRTAEVLAKFGLTEDT